MGKTTSLFRLRLFTLFVADVIILYSGISTLLLPYLPVPLKYDILGIAGSYQVYLPLAIIWCLGGIIGAFREHALSIHVFSTFLLVDSVLSLIPRFLIYGSLYLASSELCAPVSSSPPVIAASPKPYVPHVVEDMYPNVTNWWASVHSGWSTSGCRQIVIMSQTAVALAIISVSMLQIGAGLVVRRYARRLAEDEWVGEVGEEAGRKGCMADMDMERKRIARLGPGTREWTDEKAGVEGEVATVREARFAFEEERDEEESFFGSLFRGHAAVRI